MQKKSSPISVLYRPREKTSVPVEVHMLKNTKPPKLRLWFVSLLVLGVLVLSLTSFATWNWLRAIKFTANTTPTQALSTALSVQRTASYAGLSFTIANAQYATSFLDDAIHPGAAVVRLNMHVANTSGDHISVFYYDIARLLASHLSPFSPTNVSLSAGPAPGKSENGWLDFAVPTGLQLSSLKLQLGSTLLGEYLVTIPFSGSFDASRYTDHTSQQSLIINYTFQHHLLSYRLLRVDTRYSYRGSQVKAGQEFYILNFRVDNPNGITVSPGYGYDYIRLVFNAGPLPPSDNTLPYGFNAGAIGNRGITGRVVYTAPAGLRSLTIDFLVQYGSGGTDYTVSI